MKKVITLFMILLSTFILAQEVDVNSNEIVANSTFDKLMMQDLNFLVNGENTPSQGLAIEIKDNEKTLSLKGLLIQEEKFVITLDGTFAVDDGVYFFDEKGGSKTSDFTVNVFIPTGGSRWYDLAKTSTKTQRTLLHNKINKEYILNTYAITLKRLQSIMEHTQLPVEDLGTIIDKEKYKTLWKDYPLIKKFIKEGKVEVNKKLLETHKLIDNDAIVLKERTYSILNIEDKKEKNSRKKVYDTIIKPDPFKINNTIKYANDAGDSIVSVINIPKLLRDYETNLEALDSIATKIQTDEITQASKVWNSKSIWYMNVSPFYKRENKDVLIYDTSIEDYDTFKDDINGDLFGGSIGINYYKQWKKSSFIYVSGQVKMARASNFSNFNKKRTLSFTDNALGGEDNGINLVQEDVLYINSNLEEKYAYGFLNEFRGEIYLTYKGIGLFTQVGYLNKSFKKEKDIDRIETYPFRIGALINLKNKDKTKNLTTLQLFVDRSDLSIDPTPSAPDQAGDWRVGFKLGLPISLKNKL
ncbi:hypothetical protein [Winogradskyella eximia]|uniref:hypothetical protein n=1 Tax=Winogradskyella eximia TaxID=262006 RepID=UPI0024911BAC|nr:hypothetical protein [Winogradskyella eximia]